MTVKGIYRAITILAAVGILLSVYLLVEQITQSSFRPCTINSTVNCDAVISGSVSKTLGIPTPLYGLIGYIVILFGALLHKRKTVIAMAAFGLAFCLWIAYQELFLLHVICPVCIGCQVDMISVFTLILLVNKAKKNE
jgi:uncharacterized membrane protein